MSRALSPRVLGLLHNQEEIQKKAGLCVDAHGLTANSVRCPPYAKRQGRKKSRDWKHFLPRITAADASDLCQGGTTQVLGSKECQWQCADRLPNRTHTSVVITQRFACQDWIANHGDGIHACEIDEIVDLRVSSMHVGFSSLPLLLLPRIAGRATTAVHSMQ